MENIKASMMFDVKTVTRSDIIDLLRTYGYDNGAHVHGLLLQIAELKGFAPITIADLYPDKTHQWNVVLFYTNGAHDGYIERDSTDYEQRVSLGMHESHNGPRWYALSWVGKRPSEKDVIKKMKQHGAKLA